MRIGVFGAYAVAFAVLVSAAVSNCSVNCITSEEISRAVKACQLLSERLPGLVSSPGAEQYANDTEHWAVSSEQNSTCSIEPMSTEDVSTIIQIIGRPDIRAPFAVKSGGHAYNPGQSSTPGVQVSMARFTNLRYNEEQGTVSVGVGLTWDQIYERLEPLGIMLVGGRIIGVGVGGFSLGGGYSWKSNQHGLTIDTIVAHELVLPSGEVIHVTNTSEPDLFFGLKGGLNNFGIVTEITLEAHNQTLVFGGMITYSPDTNDEFNQAVADFSQNNTDPKAQMVANYISNGTQFTNQALIFYDAPTPQTVVFNRILSIPSVTKDVKTRTFVDLTATFGTGDFGIGPFGFGQHVTPIVKYTVPILEEIAAQVNVFADRLTARSDGSPIIVRIAPEPLLHPFAFSRGGAYPHPPSRQVSPTLAAITYQEDPDAPFDLRFARHEAIAAELRNLTQLIQAKAIEEGESRPDDILYPNYALTDTPLNLLYGQNVPLLQALATKHDPTRVMSLTGGFRFQS